MSKTCLRRDSSSRSSAKVRPSRSLPVILLVKSRRRLSSLSINLDTNKNTCGEWDKRHWERERDGLEQYQSFFLFCVFISARLKNQLLNHQEEDHLLITKKDPRKLECYIPLAGWWSAEIAELPHPRLLLLLLLHLSPHYRIQPNQRFNLFVFEIQTERLAIVCS